MIILSFSKKFFFMHRIRIIVRDYYSSGGWSCKIFYQNNFNCKFVHSTRIQRARETIRVRFLRGILTTISTTMLFCWFSFLLSFFPFCYQRSNRDVWCIHRAARRDFLLYTWESRMYRVFILEFFAANGV